MKLYFGYYGEDNKTQAKIAFRGSSPGQIMIVHVNDVNPTSCLQTSSTFLHCGEGDKCLVKHKYESLLLYV